MHRTMVKVIAFARFEHNTGAKAKAAEDNGRARGTAASAAS